MDAAAVAARVPLRLRSPARDETACCGLAFDHTGGPLVAICGLVGGAGTTTLALGLARQAAGESRAPVLVTEAADDRAGLAVTARGATPHSLSALARGVADGEAPEPAYTELAPGLRLIAATPSRATPVEPEQLRALLAEARGAHGLVLVDCGSQSAATAPILAEATHLLWVLPVTATAIARAHGLFATDVLPRPGRARETLVAIALRPRADARVRALRRLASQRCERLVLIPYSEPIARGDPSDDERLRRALTGLAGTLRRR